MTTTRDSAAAKARHVLGLADDVALDPWPDTSLEGDAVSGGFAFRLDDLAAIIGYDGGYQTAMLDETGETMDTLITGWLVEQRHRKGVPEPDVASAAPTHACPICGRPTPHQEHYPRAVCADCQARAADSTGRTIVAYNESMSGGLIVFYAESPSGPQSEIAAEVMDSGRCFVDGHPCTIREARFGGVVVEAYLPAD